MKKHYLHKVFEPWSIAVVGASDRKASVGGQVLRNIREAGFKVDVYPVNPKHKSIQGLSAYASIDDLDHPIDLVIIAIPAAWIPGVMRACGERQVGAVVVLSAGFAEVGARGQAIQNEIVDIARTFGVPLVGPNCLGVIRPGVGLNATFAKSNVENGHVALVAQSGAFCTALLDWAESNGFGFPPSYRLGRRPISGLAMCWIISACRRNRLALLQVPEPFSKHREADVDGARLIVEHALGERRYTLSSVEAKAVLSAFHIPTSASINVSSAADALVAAESVGLPVAMKINSPDITHKSDVGGMRLNIREPRSVHTAFREMMSDVAARRPDARLDGVTLEPMLERPHAREIMIGIVSDPVFGPTISLAQVVLRWISAQTIRSPCRR